LEGMAVICCFVHFKTRFGLTTKSIGEHPQSADSLGIMSLHNKYAGVLTILDSLVKYNVEQFQTQAYFINFSLQINSQRSKVLLQWLAMIFGKWNPLGAMGAAIFLALLKSKCYGNHSTDYSRCTKWFGCKLLLI